MVQLQSKLVDSFGRIGRKLRISITDRCNMRCIYCMPNGNTEWFDQYKILSYHEIVKLVTILAKLGIEKVRVTGGEPLVRPKVEDLIKPLSNIDEIKSISMTTNGLLLKDKVMQLRDAGLSSINFSLDTFNEERFKAITGIRGLTKVKNAIRAADDAGLKIKINTVIMRGWNDDEIVDFAQFARFTGYTVRFIEFMPLDGSGIWEPNLVVTKNETINRINKDVGKLVPVGNTNNSEPAMLYSFNDGIGTLGFIPSISEPFCGNCDRLRISSDGRLMTCLYENPGYDLRNMLRGKKSDKEITEYILESVKKKPEGIIKIIRTKSLKPNLNLMHRIGG
ncbi:MAG TPA: GTP 3',8-cyclase MoaA [Candidatus Nitrosopolaris sp.]|nr:GTP 3',8-cyclase MoaA [Candidatus Nitrosopolaris sp.]